VLLWWWFSHCRGNLPQRSSCSISSLIGLCVNSCLDGILEGGLRIHWFPSTYWVDIQVFSVCSRIWRYTVIFQEIAKPISSWVLGSSVSWSLSYLICTYAQEVFSPYDRAFFTFLWLVSQCWDLFFFGLAIALSLLSNNSRLPTWRPQLRLVLWI